MRDQYDAIVIGAGIIGAATAFELAKVGYRTLSVDRNPAAGYGPTSNSCAIIRVYYSTFDGVAFAWEAYHYWREWAQYLGSDDERGLARFIDPGCVVMKTEHNGRLENTSGSRTSSGSLARNGTGRRSGRGSRSSIFAASGRLGPWTTSASASRAEARSRAPSSGRTAATSPILSLPPTTCSVRRRRRAPSSPSGARS